MTYIRYIDYKPTHLKLQFHSVSRSNLCIFSNLAKFDYHFINIILCRIQENTHTGADSSSVNNIPLLSDYQHCNIICYCKEHNGQKYVLKKLT